MLRLQLLQRQSLQRSLLRPAALRWGHPCARLSPRCLSTSAPEPSPKTEPPAPQPSFMDREAAVAPADFNRLLAVPGAGLFAFSVGGIYAWAAFSEPLMRTLGVVTAAPADWSIGTVVPTLSLSAELATVRRRPPVPPTVPPSLWPAAPRPAQERSGAARAHPRSSRMPCAMGAGLVERAHAGTGQVGRWGWRRGSAS